MLYTIHCYLTYLSAVVQHNKAECKQCDRLQSAPFTAHYNGQRNPLMAAILSSGERGLGKWSDEVSFLFTFFSLSVGLAFGFFFLFRFCFAVVVRDVRGSVFL